MAFKAKSASALASASASTFDYDTWQARLVALELANEVGRNIMGLLSKKPYTASQISRELGLPISTVLYHLTRLEISGILETFPSHGKRLREVRYYSARSSRIVFNIKGGEEPKWRKN
ncbi:winged helix-turn-helix transcriptional regulator, partial [Candidatus Bathyarchaeota archaeon]|nr:winged helix-turn-helix transcriptional regulator [Candidatus Bathyarchaeota archaeon]